MAGCPSRTFLQTVILTSPKSDFIPYFIWCFLPDTSFSAMSAWHLHLLLSCKGAGSKEWELCFYWAKILPGELVLVEWMGQFACLPLGTLKSFTKSGLMCTLNFPWLSRKFAVQKNCSLKSPCENLAFFVASAKAGCAVCGTEVSLQLLSPQTNAPRTQNLPSGVFRQMNPVLCRSISYYKS